jgi:hypothetical protein
MFHRKLETLRTCHAWGKTMSAPSWLKSFAKAKKPQPSPSAERTSQETEAKEGDGSTNSSQQPPAHTKALDDLDDYEQISADEYVQMITGVGVSLPQKRGRVSEQREQTKPLKARMNEALQEGLSNPIAEDNLGFKMVFPSPPLQHPSTASKRRSLFHQSSPRVSCGCKQLAHSERSQRAEEMKTANIPIV